MKTRSEREQVIERIFGERVPTLWCPPLTHYGQNGGIDRDRIERHLAHMANWVQSLLIPGSTGDGWELADVEAREVLEIGLQCAERLGLRILIGVLKTDAEEARQCVVDTTAWLRERTSSADDLEAMLKARVCGFTVCPPKGEDLSQGEIRDALAEILDLGVPIALYQLPQITQNEMSPDTVVELAERYPNFCLFRDSSGEDRVALSKRDFGGVHLLRGAEAEYTKWISGTEDIYHGFLLSTGNCLARELHQVVALTQQGRTDEATQLSDRLTSAVNEVFGLVADLPDGNAFTNANKAMDHFFAYGPEAAQAPPPRLHAGSTLPMAIVQATGDVVQRHDLMPESGYL